jgi:hypothetical protein
MAALGQKQTYAVQHGMSALAPKADMCVATRDVCFGPIADMCQLFDHLIGEGEHIGRDGQSQRTGRADVDDQLELGQLQNR